MDIIKYSEEHNIFRQAVRKFLEKEVIPYVEEWEEAGIVPRSIWKKMGDQGFLCMDVPEEYGGLGADYLYSVILIEELVRTNHSGLAAPLHTDVVVPYMTSFGSEELKQKYLPGCISGDLITAIGMTEPNTGSDLASIRTTAVDDGDHVIINGQKTFISNGMICDLLVLATRDPNVENPHQALDSTWWRLAHRVLRRPGSSRRSGGIARTRPSSFSPTAGCPRPIDWVRKAAAS
jgi:acyl-CoA dehydrogenase